MENKPLKAHLPRPIKRSSEFTQITKQGQKKRLSSFLTLFVLNSEDHFSYYGMTVSRKVGNAVVRNKLKRWVRISVRTSSWIKQYSGKKVVFMFRSQPEGFYKKLLYKDFTKSLV